MKVKHFVVIEFLKRGNRELNDFLAGTFESLKVSINEISQYMT